MLSNTDHQKMQINSQDEYLIPVRMTIIKRQEIISVGEDVEKWEFLYTVGRNINWCSTMEISIEVLK